MREDRGRANGISRFVCIESRRKEGDTRDMRDGDSGGGGGDTEGKKESMQASGGIFGVVFVFAPLTWYTHPLTREMPGAVILQGEDISEDKETATAPQTMQINWKACSGQGDK